MASDHKRVNRGEEHEVRYMARTRGTSKKAVKKASRKAGPMRKKVDRALGSGKKK